VTREELWRELNEAAKMAHGLGADVRARGLFARLCEIRDAVADLEEDDAGVEVEGQVRVVSVRDPPRLLPEHELP